MRSLPSNPRLIPVLLGTMALVACDGTTNPQLNVPDAQPDDLQVATNTLSENPFLGAWRLTSIVVGDNEQLFGLDQWFVVNFKPDGTLWSTVFGDRDHVFCVAPETSCGWGGTYTYTRTTITTEEPDHPDPDERGPDLSLYASCGNQMVLMDRGDEDVGSRAVFERSRRDCYAQDCS